MWLFDTVLIVVGDVTTLVDVIVESVQSAQCIIISNVPLTHLRW